MYYCTGFSVGGRKALRLNLGAISAKGGYWLLSAAETINFQLCGSVLSCILTVTGIYDREMTV